ncbi:MAG: hypothetical protein LAP21_25580 [Acidobacteriia bacterium]|nr:hypothetical protein [Terriglobia bacterium]
MLKHVILIFFSTLMLAGAAFRLTAAAAPVPPQFRQPRQTDAEREMEERQQKIANKKRQEDLQKDTQKLFVLASELKDAVDKSNENTLSLEVIRKAEEVEKLAKRVKEKMREGTGKPLHAEPPPRIEPPHQ